jgi:hypothetical protein
MAGQVRHLEKGDCQGRQKLLIPTMAVSQNMDSVCRSFWMAGQVRHFKKSDRQGSQKVLILTIAVSRNVDGVSRSF